MRLFKRLSTSPQLVSAGPISQDVTPDVRSSELGNVEHLARVSNSTGEKAADVTLSADNSAASSTFSTRKGISTWGRKVGRRWERLRRSESAELLSMSGRRRRWSPNAEISGDGISAPEKPEVPSSCGTGIPKRISRVESLRNLFRASERSFLETSKEDVRIDEEEEEEEDDDDGDDNRRRMEKAFSDGALVGGFSMVFRDNSKFRNNAEGKKRPRPLEDKGNVDGAPADVWKSSYDLGNASRNESETRFRDDRTSNASGMSAKVESCRRALFNDENTEEPAKRSEGGQRSLNAAGGLDELMQALRLGCDESGYDSDSTRAGADSPDSESNNHRRGSGAASSSSKQQRSFSITSEDYQGIDLSLPMMSTPRKKKENAVDEDGGTKRRKKTASGIGDDRAPAESEEMTSLDDTIKTEMTLMSDEDADADTDSCGDDDEFPELRFHRNFEATERKPEVSHAERTSRHVQPEMIVDSIQGRSRLKTDMPQMAKCRLAMRGRRASNASVLNLLENAASPSKDSPPACKVNRGGNDDRIGYYSPKRPRSTMESGSADGTTFRAIKRPQVRARLPGAESLGSPRKTLGRRELRTVRFEVEESSRSGNGGLGMRLERREAARPFYVVASLEENGCAAVSGKIHVGDEVVRVCGRRLRGMSAVEARNALKKSTGVVELQIAAETLSDRCRSAHSSRSIRVKRASGTIESVQASKAIGATRPPKPISAVRDSRTIEQVQSSKTIGLVRGSDTMGSMNEAKAPDGRREEKSAIFDRPRKSLDGRRIVGEIRDDLGKIGKSVSMIEAINVGDNEGTTRLTGMKKFHFMKKRNSMPVAKTRKTLTTTDLLTIILEKGATKKLGFTIVGGADSGRGNIGIYVKDVMPGGQAADEGTLRPGDEILAVNGQLVDGLSHAKALQLFKLAKPGKLMLHVARRDASATRKT